MAQFYRKIDPRIWKDEKFRKLDHSGKLIVFYILTAQANRIGLFNFSPGMAAEDLGMSYQTFHQRFQNVLVEMNWKYDEPARVLYLPKWWKYNVPENSNVMVGNLKDLHEIPDTALLTEFRENVAYLCEGILETFTQTLGQTLPQTSGEPYPKQKQKQEQKQKQKQKKESPSDSDPPPDSVKAIFDFWQARDGLHDHQTGLKSVHRKAIASRLKEFSEQQIKLAIFRYSELLADPNHWLKKRWTIDEFMSRGQGKWIERFIADTWREDLANYPKDGGGKAPGWDVGRNDWQEQQEEAS